MEILSHWSSVSGLEWLGDRSGKGTKEAKDMEGACELEQEALGSKPASSAYFTTPWGKSLYLSLSFLICEKGS